jgi:hypothetical protein
MSYPGVDLTPLDELFTSSASGSIPVNPFSGRIKPNESFIAKTPGDSLLDNPGNTGSWVSDGIGNNPDDTNTGVPYISDGPLGLVFVECPDEKWLDPKETDAFTNNSADAFPEANDTDMFTVKEICSQALSIDPDIRSGGIAMMDYMYLRNMEKLFGKENEEMVEDAAVNMIASEHESIRDIGINIACGLFTYREARKACIIRCDQSFLNDD